MFHYVQSFPTIYTGARADLHEDVGVFTESTAYPDSITGSGAEVGRGLEAPMTRHHEPLVPGAGQSCPE